MAVQTDWWVTGRIDATATEINALAGAVAGTAAVGKVLIPTTGGVVDALDITAPKIGGTAIAATAAEINAACDKSAQTQAIVAASTAITVDGTIRRVTLTSAVNGAFTLAAPSAAMKGETLVIEFIGAGTNAATLALTEVIGGTAATTASFNAANETLVLIGGELKWTVLAEVGVTLS